MIEVEIRGKLNEKEFEGVLSKFHKKAKFVKEKDRLTLCYFKDFFKDVREIKNEKIDLRLRVTDKNAEVVMKYGLWSSTENRKEILIPIALDKFDEAVELLKILGWTKGVLVPNKTYVFTYKDVEFAIVKSCGHYYFEAEHVVDEKENENYEQEKKEIIQICKEFNLAPMDEEEFCDMMNSMNNDTSMQFDLSKQKFKDVKKRFQEFF
jgi:hypothetical protein